MKKVFNLFNKISNESLNLIEENIKVIQEHFPEAVSEGKVDFEKLGVLLGQEEYHDVNTTYQLTWKNKNKAIKNVQVPSKETLRPDKSTSVNWDETQNIYIEGDNFEALKLMQKSYFGKVKLIYIDPPYNTGQDFVYPDDYQDTMANYKMLTDQMTKANQETNGRFHTDWLNMIYPRLRLARNLLQDDGVIFISIDDSEVANLRLICDEIFGSTNFIAQVIWERAYSPVNLKKHFSESHDYILCYAKNIDNLICNGLKREEEGLARYKNPDNDSRGPWKASDLSVGPVIEEKVYEIITPSGRKVMPPAGYCWRLSKERFQEFVKDNRIWFGESGNNVPAIKRFLSEVKSTVTPMTIWKYADVGHSQEAKQALKKLFDDKAYFDYPKPVKLMKRILELYSNPNTNDIVLDFFSGSATMAHAVMEMNAEDKGNRRFIMVQFPEKLKENTEAYSNGMKSICDIGKERIRLAAQKIMSEFSSEDLDLGFKVFQLDSSNIKPWNNTDAVEDLLSHLESNIIEGRTNEDLLYEILLKIGLPLTAPIEIIDINRKVVYNVAFGSVLLCLDDDITIDVVNEMLTYVSEDIETKVIFKEIGFRDDTAKTNAIQTLKKHGIKEENIRSV